MREKILIAAATAGIVTLVAMPATLRWLEGRALLDVPNLRSSHTTPTPRGAGLAVVGGFGVGALLAAVGAWVAVLVVLGYAALGLADDLRHLSASTRLGAQIALGGAAGAAAAVLAPGHLAVIYTAVLGIAVLPAAVNAVNFMDGIDGITGLNTAVSGSLFAAAALHVNSEPVVVIAVAIAAAALGFLPWNLVRARAFLGDVGSYAIGAILGICALGILRAGGGPLAAVGPLGLYMADTGTTIVRRAARHEALFQAHRAHIYQRLVALGATHLQVAVCTALLSAAVGGLCLHMAWSRNASLPAITEIITLLAAYVASPALLGRFKGRARF